MRKISCMHEPDNRRLFDPICGMWLADDEVATTYEYIGRTYVFCSVECCALFARAPEQHVARLAHDAYESIAYVCPHQQSPDDQDQVCLWVVSRIE